MRRALIITAVLLLSLVSSAPPAWGAEWRWPLHGEVITPYRNGDDPYAADQHRGIDIAGEVGDPVVAAAGGEVRFAGTVGASGLTVSVRTIDGFDTSYLHLSSISVRAGERVAAGDRLGAVGVTGTRSAVQPHLHFGVREAGTRHAYRNPLDFLPPPGTMPSPHETPAPAPAPAPAPRTPAPAPAPLVPSPSPRRVPVSSPHRVPAPRPVPLSEPRHLPARRRVPAGHPGPAGRRVPAGHRVPLGRRVPSNGRLPSGLPLPSPRSGLEPIAEPGGRSTLAPGGSPAAAPRARPSPDAPPAAEHRGFGSPGHGRGEAGASAPGASSQLVDPHAEPVSPARRTTANQPAGGPDLGWVLACAGLLLAAAILAATDDGRKAARRGLRGIRPFGVRALRSLGVRSR
jgi:hypothetical protein